LSAVPELPARPRRTATTRPTVLFVDEHGWDCFFQLSTGLRRAGFRTIRITATPFRRSVGQLCFDRTVGLSSPDELDGLAEILDGEQIVDVQVVDALSVPTARGLSRLVDNPALADWPTGRPGRPRWTNRGWPSDCERPDCRCPHRSTAT
jgi:hypothetical protein